MFSSHTLQNKEEETIDANEAVNGKVIALVFSAVWSPPCLKFVPKLRELYEELKYKRRVPFEVIFVSLDKSRDDMQNFMQNYHGDWWASEFDSSLSKYYKILPESKIFL